MGVLLMVRRETGGHVFKLSLMSVPFNVQVDYQVMMTGPCVFNAPHIRSIPPLWTTPHSQVSGEVNNSPYPGLLDLS